MVKSPVELTSGLFVGRLQTLIIHHPPWRHVPRPPPFLRRLLRAAKRPGGAYRPAYRSPLGLHGAGIVAGRGDGAAAVFCPGIRLAAPRAKFHYLFAACVCALLANLAQTFAVRHLPMAISVAIGQALAAIVTLIYEFIGGRGLPPLAELACIAGVMTGVIILGWISGKGQRLGPQAKPLFGIIACIVFGIAMASALVPWGLSRARLTPSLPLGLGKAALAYWG